MADEVKFDAKPYTNRKNEKKMNVSGSVEAFAKLQKGDVKAEAAFEAALKDALKS